MEGQILYYKYLWNRPYYAWGLVRFQLRANGQSGAKIMLVGGSYGARIACIFSGFVFRIFLTRVGGRLLVLLFRPAETRRLLGMSQQESAHQACQSSVVHLSGSSSCVLPQHFSKAEGCSSPEVRRDTVVVTLPQGFLKHICFDCCPRNSTVRCLSWVLARFF